MIEIDGSFGEGGGQILRSSVALAAITGQDLRINNIRAGRKKPGLKRQHVTAVQAARTSCGGVLEGDQVGSSSLLFYPGEIQSGNYEFRIGTAGSTCLVLQTILLPLLFATDGPTTVSLEGGTHNPMAPSFDFLQQAYFPLLRKMGGEVTAELKRYGFYPAGGGRVEFRIEPIKQWKPLKLLERGKLANRRVAALVSKLPLDIAKRELDLIRRRTRWSANQFHAVEIEENPSHANVVMIQLDFQNLSELFIGFGEKRLPAEKVAQRLLRETNEYLKATAPVGEHLADQLLLPMALAAQFDHVSSEFVTHVVSGHTETHIHIIQRFLDVEIEYEEQEADVFRFQVHHK